MNRDYFRDSMSWCLVLANLKRRFRDSKHPRLKYNLIVNRDSSTSSNVTRERTVYLLLQQFTISDWYFNIYTRVCGSIIDERQIAQVNILSDGQVATTI